MKKKNFIQLIVFCFFAFSNNAYLQAQCNKGPSTIIITNNNYSNLTFSGDVIIRNNAIVNMTGTIKMKKDAKIAVEPGARLNINNALITSDCPDDMWQGIESHGTNSPFMSRFGWVDITNSTIQKAKIACMNSENSAFYNSKRGGIFRIYNSNFINNWYAIRSDLNNNALRNQAVFPITNCLFELNDNKFRTPNQSLSLLGFPFNNLASIKRGQIEINGGDVSISNCVFNMKAGLPSHPFYGIIGLNSYMLIENCTSNNIAQSFFLDNFSSPMINSVGNIIRNSTFNQITTSEVKNYLNINVFNNRFSLQNQNTNNTTGCVGSLRITSCPGLNFFNNSFQTFILNCQSNPLIFENCGSFNAEVRNNSFTNTSTNAGNGHSILALYNNGTMSTNPASSQGLNFTCNNFRGGNFNTTGSGIRLSPHANSTIRQHQARRFSMTLSAAGNLIRQIVNPTSNPIHYYYNGNANSSNPQYPTIVGTGVNIIARSSGCQTPTGPVGDGGIWVIPNAINAESIGRGLSDIERKEVVNYRDLMQNEILNYKSQASALLVLPENYETLNDTYANISVLKGEKDLATMALLRHEVYQKRNDLPYSRARIFDLCYSFENMYGDIMVADYYFFENQLDSNQMVLEQIKTKYPLNESETTEINDLKKFYQILYPFQFTDRTWNALNENEINVLKSIANATQGIAKHKACSWLEHSGVLYCSDTNTPQINENLVNPIVNDSVIVVYPNPAQHNLNVALKLPSHLSNANLRIYNSEGNIIYNQNISTDMLIEVSAWHRGYYYFVLEANNTVLKSGAISLIE